MREAFSGVNGPCMLDLSVGQLPVRLDNMSSLST